MKRLTLLLTLVLSGAAYQASAHSENGASWSPDGVHVAFHSNKNGGSQIFVINTKTNQWRQLTTEGFNRYPSWAPDGKSLVFMGWGEHDKNFITYTIKADASEFKRLSELEQRQLGPTVSPDGKVVSYCVADTNNKMEIWLMDIDGTNNRKLSSDTWGGCWSRWSPAGDSIVFGAGYQENGELNFDVTQFNLKTKKLERLTTAAGNDWGASYNHDGSRILFNTLRDSKDKGMMTGHWNLYSMKTDGTDVRKEVDDIAFDSTNSVSPDGSKLLFASKVYGDSELMIKDLVSGNISRLTQTSIYNRTGQRGAIRTNIVFESKRSGNSEIYLAQDNGKQLRNLTNHPANDFAPAASSVPGRFAFISDRTGSDQLFLQERNKLIQLTKSSKQKVADPFFSANGTKLLYSISDADSSSIVMYDLNKRDIVTLAEEKTGLSNPILSQDGRILIYTQLIGTNYHVVIKNTVSNEYQYIKEENVNTMATAISDDGSELMLTSNRSGNYDLYRYFFHSKEMVQVTNHPATDINGRYDVDMSSIIFESRRDGNWLLYKFDLATHDTNLLSL